MYPFCASTPKTKAIKQKAYGVIFSSFSSANKSEAKRRGGFLYLEGGRQEGEEKERQKEKKEEKKRKEEEKRSCESLISAILRETEKDYINRIRLKMLQIRYSDRYSDRKLSTFFFHLDPIAISVQEDEEPA